MAAGDHPGQLDLGSIAPAGQRYSWDPSCHGTIPIYLRDHFKRSHAPLREIERFAPDRVLSW